LFDKEITTLIRYPAGKPDEQYSIPNSVTTIGGYAFEGCTNLKSISIPNSVTKIEDRAFEGCTNLKSISIPNSVTKIGNGAFKGCTNLNSISISNSVTTIGYIAFSGCISLNSIIITSTVTCINFSLESSDPKEIICKAIVPPIIKVGSFVKEEIYSTCTLYVPDASLEDYKWSKERWSYFRNILPLSKYPTRKIYTEDGYEVSGDLLS
jgi:hypothetical protein